MQQSQKAAPEAEAERDRVFLRVGHGRIVELELFERVAKVLILGPIRRIYTREDHRLRLLIAGKRFGRWIFYRRNGIADSRVGDGLDGSREIADLARAERIGRAHAKRMQIPDLDDLVDSARRHHLNIHPGLHHAVYHAHVDNRAAVGVILAVENQTLQGSFPVSLRRGNVVYDHLEHSVDVDAVFGRDLGRVHRRKANHVLNFVLDLLGSCRGQVDLIDDGQHFKAIVDGKVGVRERLRLNALRRVDNQHRALAGRQAPRDLVVEVHVARGVDEVQNVVLPIVRPVIKPHGARLDRNAALALEVHGI